MTDTFVRELEGKLPALLGESVEIEHAALIMGGASKEAWVVDARTVEGTLELFIRRDAGGVIYSETLSMEQEYRVLRVAHEWGVKVPKPYGFIEDFDGREASVMERVEGESIGRRVVKRPEFEAARGALPGQMVEELCKIHRIPFDDLPPLPGAHEKLGAAHNMLKSLEYELDALEEPHPAISLGLAWLRDNPPESHGVVLNHGDFRIGNLILDEEGLRGVIDWEFAHLGDPAEDLAWPLVRSWRFGMDDLRLGGVGEVEPYLEHYNELSGRRISLSDLFYWEVAGNVRWAIGALNQARRHLSGQERSVELAVLGRMAAEVEYEILSLIERGG